MKFKAKITINKPVNEVYRYVLSPTKMPEWTAELVSVKPIKGRRTKEGSIMKHILKEVKGEKLEIKEEILTVKRNEEFAVLLTHTNMVSTVTYLFSAINNNGTLLTVHVKTTLYPRVMNIFGIFMRIVMKKRQEEDLRKLKKRLESA